MVLPDILANAGGVVVSYFEWVQGLQEYFWKEVEVNAKLNDIVVRAFEETWSARDRFGTSMRTAAYGLAVQRVNKVLEARRPIVDAIKNGKVQLVFNTTEARRPLPIRCRSGPRPCR